MNALLEAANEVCAFMEERGWSYCIIGGLAVQHWGEPRTTLDADFTLVTGWGEEEPYVTALLQRFESRIPDAHTFALARRVLLVRASNGKDIDIALGALPFEVDMVCRAVPVEFSPGVSMRCCTAEDLFVMKAFAGRSRDWLDAESVAARQANLDSKYIARHLTDLCALRDDRETLGRAKHILQERE
jgi:hypothetical protein